MQTKEFARRVQASFDAAFGSGTSVVKVLGPSPDDVTATVFDVMVRPPFGARFAVPNKQLKDIPETDESAGSIAALSCQLGRDMLEPVQQFMNALVIADPSVFLPGKLEPTFDEIIEASNREVAAEGVFSATKKPVTIQAMLYDGENWVEIAQWLRAHEVKIGRTSTGKASIPTLEGTIYASPGDYVIQGVQGEFYPCKPDIFEATYDIGEVSEEQSDVEELKALLTQALEERDEARAALSALQSEKEVSE